MEDFRYGMEENCQYGIWKNRLPFHSIPCPANNQSLASDSAIGLHLLQNPTCAQHYDDSRFFILAQGRSPFHLSALEYTFIKTSNPALCRQKEFVYSLKIVHLRGSFIGFFSANHSLAFSNKLPLIFLHFPSGNSS